MAETLKNLKFNEENKPLPTEVLEMLLDRVERGYTTEEVLLNKALEKFGLPVKVRDENITYAKSVNDKGNLRVNVNPKAKGISFQYSKQFSNGGPIAQGITEANAKLSPAQALWVSSLLDPTMATGAAEMFAGYPSFPSKDMTVAEMLTGPRDPSFIENIQQGNYGTAALQTAGIIPGIGAITRLRKVASLRQKIRQLKHDELRENINIPKDGEPARRARTRLIKQRVKAEKALEKEKAAYEADKLKAIQKTEKAPTTMPKGGIETLLNKELVVHSSPKTGIETLKLNPSGTSPGGLYLNRSFADPRILDYAEGLVSQGSPKGAAYLTRPSFNRTLDAENIDKNTLNRIGEVIGDYRPKGSPTPKNTNTEYVLQGILKNKTKDNMYFPHGFSKELNTAISDLGFDSLRYPPRQGFEKLGESDTLISLFPEDTLDVVEEIPYEDILKRMYELRKYNE